MNKHNFFFFLIFILYVIDQLIGLFFPNSIFTFSSSFLFLFFCSFYFIQTYKLREKSSFVKLWILFIFLLFLYILFIPDDNLYAFKSFEVSFLSSIRIILTVNFCFYPFYFFSRKNIIREKEMIMLFLLLLPIFIYSYLISSNQIYRQLGEGFQVNAVYALVYILPYVIFFKKQYSVFIGFLIILIVISGLKRGAILTSTFIFLVMVIQKNMYFIQKKQSKININKVKQLIYFLVISVFTLTVVFNNETLLARFQNVLDDGGSRRDLIFQSLLFDLFYNSGIFNFIFGYGFGGTINSIGALAHNDLIEVFYNYGGLGLCFYVFMLYKYFRLVSSINFQNNENQIVLIKTGGYAILFLWILDSMYHRFYSGLYSVPSVMLMGYIVGKIDLYSIKSKISY